MTSRHDPRPVRRARDMPVGAPTTGTTGSTAVGDRIDLDERSRDDQDPARERAPPRRRRGRRAEDVETLLPPGGRAARPRRRSRSCRPGSSSRTSPACPRSSTSPSCATRWPTSAATRRRSTRSCPADLVIDHSVQVDQFGTPGAFAFNVEREYERNGERYQLLRWAQTAFRDLRVVPPGHRASSTRSTSSSWPRSSRRAMTAMAAGSPSPTRSSGTDSHTTMVNGLGVLGYGVGGIEAEAVLLGQPLYQPMPQVVGVRLHGELPRGIDRDRPRPGRDRDAARPRCRRRVRRVRRRRAGRPWRWPTGRRSAT